MDSHRNWSLLPLIAPANLRGIRSHCQDILYQLQQWHDQSRHMDDDINAYEKLDLGFERLECVLQLLLLQQSDKHIQAYLKKQLMQLQPALQGICGAFLQQLTHLEPTSGQPAWVSELRAAILSQDRQEAAAFSTEPNHLTMTPKQALSLLADRRRKIALSAYSTLKPLNAPVLETGKQADRLIQPSLCYTTDIKAQHYFNRLVRQQKTRLTRLWDIESSPWQRIFIPLSQAIETIVATAALLSPLLAQEILLAFEQQRIRIDEQSPALCLDTPAGAYISVPYHGRLSDFAQLAHECGHLLHQQQLRKHYRLLQKVSPIHSEALAIAMESLAVQFWGKQQKKKAIATAWQQHQDIEWQHRHAMLANFEHLLYQIPELSLQNVNNLWTSCNRAFYGPKILFEPGFEYDWLALPHIFHAPFYLSAYPKASQISKEYLANLDLWRHALNQLRVRSFNSERHA